MSLEMIAEERRRKLLEALKKNGALSVANASEMLRVSRMTVHRDLDTLSAAGLLRKVHGGAVPVISKPSAKETAMPFTERKPANATAKELIAKHVAKIVATARTLAFDASTTVFALAGVLKTSPENPNPFVLTNGVPLFMELQRRNVGFRLALTGGEPHPRTGSLVGPLAIKTLEGMRFDFAIVSAAGLMEDEGQVYDSTPEGAAVKQAFMARANKVILCLDTTKINFLAPYPLGVLNDFDILVTENGVREIAS
ncbi:MAG TPA: DeoR/GlpR family DNA-binding transcription regulator [Planctomycetota bacterium]|nr:DeoR/GlpR family DNA-binding transcription regulator [Planctomycetota bacterium]